MTEETPRSNEPLRLWPGVVLVTLLWLLRFGLPAVQPELLMIGGLGALLAALLVLVWWVFFSRASWTDRLGAVLLIVVAIAMTYLLADPSLAYGMMGLLIPAYALPLITLGLVLWATFCQDLADLPRRASLFAIVMGSCLIWTLFRSDGLMGTGAAQLAWRWSESAEQRLVASAATPQSSAALQDPSPAQASDWPGFRGPQRDGIVRNLRIDTDWVASPPIELWRHPVGPGWSSFAVRGDLLYTQEQRGEEERVACYRVSTGELVWSHSDPIRFWEAAAGAGPRATPYLEGDRVYALGATGILNALDASDGTLVWSRNLAADSEVDTPTWGFSGSPLVRGGMAIVAAGSRLVAYDAATGELRWLGPADGQMSGGREGYSSPHFFSIAGVDQIVLMSARGATSVTLADGTPLWQHIWGSAQPIVQPARMASGDLLVTGGQGNGIRRLALEPSKNGWTVQPSWSSKGLKPYFNDFVAHEGHAFGFDGRILSSIDLESGERNWKGGRYGSGQLVLLAEQDLLLVLTERGELVLVSATPEGFAELARVPAIEGKTWNHPAVVGDVLLVRNDQQMAAFRLPAAPEGQRR